MVDPSQLLGALPGHIDLKVALVGLDRSGQPYLLAFREAFLGAAQHLPDLVERVVSAAPVAMNAPAGLGA